MVGVGEPGGKYKEAGGGVDAAPNAGFASRCWAKKRPSVLTSMEKIPAFIWKRQGQGVEAILTDQEITF